MQQAYPNNGFRSYWRTVSATSPFRGSVFSGVLSWVYTFLKVTAQIVKDAAIELAFLVVFWLVITKMGQGRDLIVSLFEPDGIYNIGRIFYTVLSVISFSVSMWIIPAYIFQKRDRKDKEYGRDTRPGYRTVFQKHLFFAHRVLPLVPFWLMAYVLFHGPHTDLVFFGLSFLVLVLLNLFNEKVKAPGCRGRYVLAVGVLLLGAITWFCFIYKEKYTGAKVALSTVLYLLSFLMNFIFQEVDQRILAENQKPDDPRQPAFYRYRINSWFYLAYLCFHLVIIVLVFSPRRFVIAPESMMLYLFSLNVFLIDLLVYVVQVSPLRRLLATVMVLGVVLLFLLSPSVNLNLHHYTIDRIDDSSVLRGRERLAFADRYAVLKERIRAKMSPQPYPILLVSGEGGGSRAGLWLSQNLINFDYATRGRFREHIFSTSTVSGSSIGLSTVLAFWEQPQQGDSIDGKWLDLPSKVFANNFVGSSISGLLLTDFWRTVLPFQVERDRNSLLQEEEAYYTQKALIELQGGRKLKRHEEIPDSLRLLRRDFMGFFYETDSGRLVLKKDRPLVLINTTRSNDGRRGIFSPVKLQSDVFNDAIDINAYLYEDSVCDDSGAKLCYSRKRNISLGQVCNTSELFPLFSAPAYIDSLGSFVDAGYHENSGLKTTLDVYEKLKDTLHKDGLDGRYEIFILYLKNGSSVKELYKPLPSEAPITLPFKALYSQPFQGSTSYFEERARYVGRKDPSVQYIEVQLDHRQLVETAIVGRDPKIEKQILADLTSAIDTTKKDTTLNFPLARWLSMSVIHRMRANARRIQSTQPNLKALLERINAEVKDTVRTTAPASLYKGRTTYPGIQFRATWSGLIRKKRGCLLKRQPLTSI
ncbi:hypothetical protein V9K67_06775 [Paraflavisolibacter sp. H34]|uniref:hypothetical protein n=1 Tax=Huijunlia imazamoxiresistens TaxID=3127457 RepID=UPI00301992D3